VTGYALTFGSFLLLGGRAGDVLGRRRLLFLGLVLFALTSLTCGLAFSPLLLILARFLQGGGAALVSPAALSFLTTTNAEGAARNRALGLWQATTAAGASTGVVAGGILTQYLGWRAIFLVNVPIIAVLLCFIPSVLPSDKSGERQRLDVLGAGLITASAASLMYGLSNGQQQGFGAPGTLLALLLAVLFAVVFVLAERKVSTPLVSFAYFLSPTHRASVGAMFLMGAVVSGYVYFTSLYLQKVQGFGPLLTGLALIPATGTVILTSTFLTRRLLARLGVKRMLLIGLTSIGAGQIWLSFLSLGGSYLTVVLPGMLLTAFGMGLAFPSASVGATTGVAQQQQGMVGGLFATSQQIGSAIGLALLATVAATRTQLSHGSLAAGYGLAYLVATGCILIAGILVATQLSHKACEAEFARQSREGDQPRTDALIRKG